VPRGTPVLEESAPVVRESPGTDGASLGARPSDDKNTLSLSNAVFGVFDSWIFS
jgi:hypothetical protein